MKTLNNITVQVLPEALQTIQDARFPKMNKNDWMADYDSQLSNPSDYNIERVKVTGFVNMNSEQWEVFSTNLLSNMEWLKGTGGTDSTYEFKNEYKDMFAAMGSEEWEDWKKGAYRLAVMVCGPEGKTVLVDCQGYSYARYVGYPM